MNLSWPVVCEECGRALTHPVSRHVGYGPVCRAKMGIVVVTVRARHGREMRRYSSARVARGVAPGQMELEFEEPQRPNLA